MGPFFESVQVKIWRGHTCASAWSALLQSVRVIQRVLQIMEGQKGQKHVTFLHVKYAYFTCKQHVFHAFNTCCLRVKNQHVNTREICVKCMWKISLNGSVPLAAEDLALTIYVSLGGCTIHILGYHHLTCLIIVFFSFLLFFV